MSDVPWFTSAPQVPPQLEGGEEPMKAAEQPVPVAQHDQTDAAKLTELREWARGTAAKAAPQPPPVSLADELAKLAALREQGVLSAEEFESVKRGLLTSGAG